MQDLIDIFISDMSNAGTKRLVPFRELNQILKRDRKVANKPRKKSIRLGPLTNGHSVHNQPELIVPDFEVNKIYCGDSIEVMRKMPSNFVDLIITSPPYNFGLEYETHDDTKNWQHYFDQLNQVWKECERALKPSGRICVNVQPLFSDYIPTHHIISKQLLDLGLLWKAEIIWEKNNYNCKYTAWGSWKSPSMPYFKYTWEFIEVFCKGSYKKEGPQGLIDITGDEFKKWVYLKWSIAPEMNMKHFEHPAMFPEDVPYRLIKLLSYRNDIVLDPFNGCGTTTLVAKKNGRRFIGIDISEKYCKIAQQRLDEILL
ncbi:MAG: site-specific DNA-methyltransferase [candidate division Zixibacteria bacterium]|nr:site-specific DNA-methyltransferase [candidate division Zixibacteria bacterium]